MAWRWGSAALRRRTTEKVFCIGLNKTGTTSLETALQMLGYRMGNQRAGEELLEDWAQRKFGRIVRLAETADAFQDVPFSLPFTFQALDQYFPNAKFILSIRNSASEWYASLTRFHSQLWADGERTPTATDLKRANYAYPGYAWLFNRLLFNTLECDPYNQESLLAFYQQHLYHVREYFRHRPGKLLIVNVAVPHDYRRLCDFLGKTRLGETFPWLNKSTDKNGPV